MSEHDKNLHDGSSGPEGSEQPDQTGSEQGASANDVPVNLDDLAEKLQQFIADPANAPQAAFTEGVVGEGSELSEDAQRAEEYLNDLKRLQAEYQNYRKRVDRDRETDGVIALVRTLAQLVPVLDDLDRADAAGDVEGNKLEPIVKKFQDILQKMGLTRFGAVGDVFDPKFHEAVFKNEVEGATEETVFDVIEPGYMVGDRELRPAKVAVQVPKA